MSTAPTSTPTPASVRLPKGWAISGWGPEGEGVEARGPNAGDVVVALSDQQLPEAIRKHNARKAGR